MQSGRCSVGRKTLVKRVGVDETVNAHNCQSNQKHRLQRGDRRLKVWRDRSPEHYCRVCAREIIERDIQKLAALARQLDGTEPIGPAEGQ
jgi:hypothetical protein